MTSESKPGDWGFDDSNSTEGPPLYDCHVILSRADSDGQIKGRMALLPEIYATASTEREVLRTIVEKFKHVAKQHHQAGTPIPWTHGSETLAEGELERWLPVHL